MKDYHNFYWTEEIGGDTLIMTICPHCDSRARYFPADDDDPDEVILCGVCMRVTSDDTPQGEVQWHFKGHECPECGWHVMEWLRGGWRCNRCRAWYGGDSQSGPVGPATYQQKCPTCGEPAIVVVERDDQGRPTAYECENCEFTFLANRLGLIEPEPCRACGRVAVHRHTHVTKCTRREEWHQVGPKERRLCFVFEEEVEEAKRCAFCGQLYDLDLQPVDKNLKPMVAEEPDENKIQKSDDLQIVDAGSQFDNSLK